MNAPYEAVNAMANAICGMKPAYHRTVCDWNFQTVTVRGIDLYVATDHHGDVCQVQSGGDGTDVTEIFAPFEDEILKAINVKQEQENAA